MTDIAITTCGHNLIIGTKEVRRLADVARSLFPPGAVDTWEPTAHREYNDASQLQHMMELGVSAEFARYLHLSYTGWCRTTRGLGAVRTFLETLVDDPALIEYAASLDCDLSKMWVREDYGEPLVGILLGGLKMWAEQDCLLLRVYVDGPSGLYIEDGYWSVELVASEGEEEITLPLLSVCDHFDGMGFAEYAGELYGLDTRYSESLRERLDAEDCEDEDDCEE